MRRFLTTDAETALASSCRDDDPRQVERVSGFVQSEVEIPRPEAGDEVDVGEPTADLPQPVPQSVSQPVPTVRVGGSPGSGTRSGVGSTASETNTDDGEVNRVRVAEGRGQKRQGEDVQELAAKAEEQHLDADVEVGRCTQNMEGRRRSRGCSRCSARTNEKPCIAQDRSVRED